MGEYWNQTSAIRAHLRSGRTITPLEALNLYGCLRLAARINDLRKEGAEIKMESVTMNGKRFARYSMAVRAHG